MSSSRSKGATINEMINADKVQLIGADGVNHGEVNIDNALEMAKEASLDLVQVSGNEDVPVCKIMDYGKFRFQSQKKASEAKKKQKVTHVKEIKLRPNIDVHDYDVKMRAVGRFIEKGDKVKVTLRFKGREMSHKELGMELLDKVKEQFSESTKVEYEPKLDGKQIMMILAPINS